MIAGRRDRPDRVSEGDNPARRPVAPWRGNLVFALRRRGLAESSESFAIDDPLQTIAGRRDRPDRAPEGDSSARRPVAPWRGNLFFALRRRGLAESSGSFANGDPLGMIAGRRDSPDRESEGDISARRHLSPPPLFSLLLWLLLLLLLLLLL